MTEPRVRVTERHVLLWIFLGFVLAYAGAFLMVVFSGRSPRADTVQRPTVRFMAEKPNRDGRYLMADLLDPSLMSLPNLHGYSRGLWRRGVTPQHRAWEPGVELAYLGLAEVREFSGLLQQPALADAVRWTVNKPVSLARVFDDAEPIPTTQAQTQSVFRIENGLLHRLLTRQPELPAIASATALRPAWVRIGVGVDGTVRYAILQRSCGSEPADAQALAAARELCFEPQNRPDSNQIEWGLVRFFWLTTGPTGTNSTPVGADR